MDGDPIVLEAIRVFHLGLIRMCKVSKAKGLIQEGNSREDQGLRVVPNPEMPHAERRGCPVVITSESTGNKYLDDR